MLELLGRLHPLVLHLPIGILAMAYIIESYSLYKKTSFDEVQRIILLFAAISASISVLTGLLLVKDGDYAGSLVNNHKWAAIALGVICWLIYFSHILDRKKIYRAGLGVSMVLLISTGHLGGSLTHGEDFLSKKGGLVVKPSFEDAELFADVIHPIFEDKCFSCHNPSKLKGEFNMTTHASILKGGENGQAILVDEPLKSPLWERSELPLSHDEHMPPDGKPQLTENEIVLLKWWLESGAGEGLKMVDIENHEQYKDLASRFLAPPEVQLFDRVSPPDSSKLERLASSGVKLYPVNSGSAAVYVNFSNDTTLTSGKLNKLRRIRNNISHLNLAGSSLSDPMISKLSRFKHLQKLELQNTKVTSKGILKMADFPFLQTLNLYGTAVDSAVIEKIASFPQLENLYLWQTDFTSDQVAKLKDLRPRLNIIYEINNDIFKESALKAPLIVAEHEIFEDSVLVSLELNFRNVEIRYLINDGDTLDYESPFYISETCEIKTLAQKEGWKTSEINSKSFVKRGLPVSKVTLGTKPHPRYANFATKVLANGKLGSNLFSDGQWVGYEGEHSKLTLELTEPNDLSNITIGVLEATGSYIFYPKALKVSVSEDGRNFSEVVKQDYKMVDGPSNKGRKNLTYHFPPRKAKYIKLDIRSHLANPDWHAAPGAKNWIFIDEIIVN